MIEARSTLLSNLNAMFPRNVFFSFFFFGNPSMTRLFLNTEGTNYDGTFQASFQNNKIALQHIFQTKYCKDYFPNQIL